MDGPTFTVDCFFGHVECESYLLPRDGKLIGMGRSRWYDLDGKLVREKNEPTGAVMFWPESEPRKSIFARLREYFGADRT